MRQNIYFSVLLSYLLQCTHFSKDTADLKQTQLLEVRENVTVFWITRVWWNDALEKNKRNKRT